MIKIRSGSRLKGRIVLPASKSISNRALVLNALSKNVVPPDNLSDSDDTEVLLRALQTMPETIDIGAAGTAMRFLTAYLSVTPGEHVITGTERMKHRPIGILVEALRMLGASITYEGEEGFPPLRIVGCDTLEGGSLSVPGDVSSQYISALLMIAPTLKNGLRLTLTGNIASRPYLDMTVSMMRDFGAKVDWQGDDVLEVQPGAYLQRPYTIESDWSAASYWFEIVALSPDANAEVELVGLHHDSLQGDSCIRQLFEPLGITTEFDENGAVLRKSSRVNSQWSMVNAEGIASGSSAVGGAGADFKEPRERSGNGQCSITNDLTTCPDLAQTMVATCCGIGVAFRFSGLQSLRIKETDRLLALQQELGKLGYRITEHDGSILESEAKREGLENSKSPNSKSIDTYNDHRMAMCMAPLAVLYKDGLIINDAQVVSKSYPTFWDDLKIAGYGVERL